MSGGGDPTNYLMSIADPHELRRRRQLDARRKYEMLVSQVTFLDIEKPMDERMYKYSEVMLPFVFFYKYLAKKPDSNNGAQPSKINRLKLWLPDTIVVNDGSVPMWLYSSEDGYVYRTDTFTSKNVIAKMCNYSSPDELVAVLKRVS
jgi:LMBR1 domain-containing protein 1